VVEDDADPGVVGRLPVVDVDDRAVVVGGADLDPGESQLGVAAGPGRVPLLALALEDGVAGRLRDVKTAQHQGVERRLFDRRWRGHHEELGQLTGKVDVLDVVADPLVGKQRQGAVGLPGSVQALGSMGEQRMATGTDLERQRPIGRNEAEVEMESASFSIAHGRLQVVCPPPEPKL